MTCFSQNARAWLIYWEKIADLLVSKERRIFPPSFQGGNPKTPLSGSCEKILFPEFTLTSDAECVLVPKDGNRHGG